MGISVKKNQFNMYDINKIEIENNSSYTEELTVESEDNEATYDPNYDSDSESNSDIDAISNDNMSISDPELNECVSCLISKMHEEEINILYDPEEPSQSKYNLVMCEPYNQNVYGNYNDYMNTQWIVLSRFRYLEPIVMQRLINTHLWSNNQYNLWKKHPFIYNYRTICQGMKPHIAECIYLQSGECVCIIKTFWIKIIQRRWKKIYHQYKLNNQNITIFQIVKNIYNLVMNQKNLYSSSKLFGILSDFIK